MIHLCDPGHVKRYNVLSPSITVNSRPDIKSRHFTFICRRGIERKSVADVNCVSSCEEVGLMKVGGQILTVCDFLFPVRGNDAESLLPAIEL